MAKPLLSNGQIYHIYNRGVDKRLIFLDINDHQRFSDGLAVFNNSKNLDGTSFVGQLNSDNRDILVNIIAYCLMPNHFHLLLEQVADNGIQKFIQKMTTSYTMYFNKRRERSGALLQGTFKRSHIKDDSKLLEISKYIHYNPFKILNTCTDTPANIEKKLLSYTWSSFPDYAGLREGLGILSNTKIILDQFSSSEDYIKFVLG